MKVENIFVYLFAFAVATAAQAGVAFAVAAVMDIPKPVDYVQACYPILVMVSALALAGIYVLRRDDNSYRTGRIRGVVGTFYPGIVTGFLLTAIWPLVGYELPIMGAIAGTIAGFTTFVWVETLLPQSGSVAVEGETQNAPVETTGETVSDKESVSCKLVKPAA